MGEKGAEVAPIPSMAADTRTPQQQEEDARALIADLLGNLGTAVNQAEAGQPVTGAAPRPQPIGELGAELPDNLRPTIPNLTSSPTPSVASDTNLSGLSPTAAGTSAGVQPPGIMPSAPAGVQPPGIMPSAPAGVQPPGITPAGLQPPGIEPQE